MELTSILPPRSLEDILFERVRLIIGGEVYDLPALVIEENERWKSELEADLTGMLTALDDAGDDISAIVSTLTGEPVRLLTLLRSYDVTNVLPSDETLRAAMTPLQLFRAVMEVWRAANPLVDIGIHGLALTATQPSESPAPTSLRRRNGAGRRAKSAVS
jgi:hypothetical protein